VLGRWGVGIGTMSSPQARVSHRWCRMLTNHIATVESHVVTPLPGTANRVAPASVIIAIAIRLTTGRNAATVRTDILQVSFT
jgi:hypothetical protein